MLRGTVQSMRSLPQFLSNTAIYNPPFCPLLPHSALFAMSGFGDNHNKTEGRLYEYIPQDLSMLEDHTSALSYTVSSTRVSDVRSQQSSLLILHHLTKSLHWLNRLQTQIGTNTVFSTKSIDEFRYNILGIRSGIYIFQPMQNFAYRKVVAVWRKDEDWF